MKYADNILKTFAVSVSLVANCLFSSLAFSVELAPHAIVGVTLVIISTWLYSIGGRFLVDEPPKATELKTITEYIPVKGPGSPLKAVDQSKHALARSQVVSS